MNPILDDYQQEACKFLRTHNRAILADERGVGKTAPAIMAARASCDYGPHLVVCPAYLMTNWVVELEMWGAKGVHVVEGSASQKKAGLQQIQHSWTIISYDTLARKEYTALLASRAWHTIIYDEAHHLRGRNSLRTKAADQLKKRSQKTWMLTGTPLVKNAGDLYPLLRQCDPKEYSSYWRFVEENCYTTKNPWTTVVGRLRDEESFYRKLKPYMLRRKFRDIHGEIPDYVEQDIYVDVSEDTRRQLTQAKQEFRIDNGSGEEWLLTSAGALLHGLRSIVSCDHAKYLTLEGLINNLNGEQFVVYTWYRDTARRVANMLLSSNVTHRTVTGELQGVIRTREADEHRAGKYRAIVATLGALQEGINLQHCKNVIFVEGDWLYKTHDQAIGRFHRRGQENTVMVWNLVARKTVDEVVFKTMRKRQSWNLNQIVQEVLNA